MQVRKRPRQPMRRTTSMKEFATEIEIPRPSNPEAAAGDRQSCHALLLQQQRNQRRTVQVDAAAAQSTVRDRPTEADWLEVGLFGGSVAPPGGGEGGKRSNSGDFAGLETAPFLMACGLCKRRLGPGRDTFMYRGEAAFCSLDCRQQHMNQVELKCSLTSIKETPQATNSSEKSDNGETVAAV